MHAATAITLARLLLGLALSLPLAARAQSETIFQPIGADTALTFAQLSLPGAKGIDFSFFGAFAPAYPDTESHTVIIVFEWGPSAAGPWSVSPDNVKTVPGGRTTLYSTRVFHGPEDAAFVRLHFYAGGLMTASGTFDHLSVVPEPASSALFAAGLALLAPLWGARGVAVRGRRPAGASSGAANASR